MSFTDKTVKTNNNCSFISVKPFSILNIQAYAQYHNKRVWTCRLANKQNLIDNSEGSKSDRVTLWLEIDVDEWAESEKIMYRPGDHVGMYATNREELVSGIIPYLQYDQDPDEPMELQMLKEKHTSTGK